MKKLITVVLAISMLSGLSVLPAFADDGGAAADYVMPGAIVDFTTQKGYDDFCAKADEFDLVSLTTGEYTVHGTNGKVQWEQVEEDGLTFARFTPIEPLDEKGLDKDGARPSDEGDFRMTAEIEFNIADYDYISFCYRTSPKAHLSQNQIYVRDDQHSGEFEGTNGMWTSNALKNKGEWTIRTIQISKSFSAASGTFKSIRIPIAGRVNEYFDIQYIVVFNSKDLCNNFSINDYHTALAAKEPEPTATPEASTLEPEDPTGEVPTDVPESTEAAKPVETEGNSGSGKKGCGGTFFGAGAALALAALPAVLKKKKKS